jgi:CBS domain containing-hemolysin-like protein
MTVLALILICMVLSAFFSGSEMAFVSCNKVRLRRYFREKKKGANLVNEFYRRPKQFLAALLVGNNLVNVTTAALTAYLFREWWGIENEFIVTLVVAPFLIIFSETVPKDFSRQKADEVVYQWAPAMNFFFRLFLPFSEAVLRFSDAVLGVFGSRERKSPFVTREEFHYLIDEGARQGIIRDYEKRLVDTILNFEKIRVEEVMTPLREVPQMEIASKVGDVKELGRRTGRSFILVYEEIPSIIVGAIHVFDVLFQGDDDQGLTHFLRAPLFVSKDWSAEKVFLKLQENHQSFAVVYDEAREAVGVVSIDNLLTV